jgi:SAM-dependent methyltransferase
VNSYLMESVDEARRLEEKTDAEAVRARLRLVGLDEGMRALDAGAGTGAIARVMAELVGGRGAVVAFDASKERLEHGRRLAAERGIDNLTFVEGDLYAPSLPAASFDFVWCEFVFEYLADPDRALAQLVRLVRPGGKLVVGDLDGNGLFHDPMPAGFAEDLEALRGALDGAFDPIAGRRLFHRFRKAGLAGMKVQALPYHLYPGAAPEREMNNWETKFKTLRPRGVRALGEARYDRFATQFLSLLRDPDALSYSVLFLVEWTRPA